MSDERMLNLPFSGSQRHHLDSLRVIYIPQKLHRMFFHKRADPNTMEYLNYAIIMWLWVESILKPRYISGFLGNTSPATRAACKVRIYEEQALEDVWNRLYPEEAHRS